jgi:hypothetical protein
MSWLVWGMGAPLSVYTKTNNKEKQNPEQNKTKKLFDAQIIIPVFMFVGNHIVFSDLAAMKNILLPSQTPHLFLFAD